MDTDLAVRLATNPFELFVDYAAQIQACSPAIQTSLIQLATSWTQHAYYLPTPRAVAGGTLDEHPFTHYSATVMNNIIGPEGGQALVDRTVTEIADLWRTPATP